MKLNTFYRTYADDAYVTWRLEHSTAIIQSVEPDGIVFRDENQPTLQSAREMMPELSGLWDAVDAELRAETGVDPSSPGHRAHSAFFSLPY